MSTAACPTSCDDDCPSTCHEVHYPRFKRDHAPEECPAVIANGGRQWSIRDEAKQ